MTAHYHISVEVRPSGAYTVRMNGLTVEKAAHWTESTFEVGKLAHALREQGATVRIHEIGFPPSIRAVNV